MIYVQYVHKEDTSENSPRRHFSVVHEKQGQVDDPVLQSFLNGYYEDVREVQADGDELERCLTILGRTIPPYTRRTHIFLGESAKEIAANWY